MKVRTLTLILAALASVACRSLVLENRSDCPAFIYFECPNDCPVGGKEAVQLMVLDARTMEELASDKPLLQEIRDDDFYLAIEKRPEIVSIGVAGMRMSTIKGTTLELPGGSQGDPIYRFSRKEILEEESTLVPLNMTKEFSRVLVRFKSEDGLFPYNVVVSANTCGIDIVTGRPVEGPFRFVPIESTPGVFLFTVPRQADYSLSLELWAEPGSKDGKEGHVDDLILWNALQNINGFSWAMESLPDLTVEIDYVKASATVLVNDWDVSSTINYIL
ncbi:MAG: hypothetical protein J5835_06670 [Bacteroidales bacterium]|nr:hypothetical protein [Bacteroidales bacterium]